MQARDLLVQRLRQHVDLLVVLALVLEQFDLRQRLIGERRRHHEARVAHGVAEVHKATFRQQDQPLAIREGDLVDLRLDVVPLHVLQGGDLNLVVEVADVADDGAILHRAHVVDGDDVLVAGGGDEDVGDRRRFFHGHHLIAFHRRLQRADRIDFRHHHAAAGLAQRSGRALADVAEAGDHRDLARQHHVGAAADAVDQRFTAAIEIVELRLGNRVVDVDRREQQLAGLLHVVQTMHARGGLFRHALDVLGEVGEVALRLLLQDALDQREEDLFFFRIVLIEEHGVAVLGAQALMHEHGGVAAVVQNHVRRAAVMPVEQFGGVVPIILQRLALDGEHRNAGSGDRGGGVVLGRIDVARHPAHFGAERDQRLDQHRGLNGHVQRAGDLGALERLLRTVLLARCHQAGHFGFGQRDFLAAELGEADVLDDVVGELGGHADVFLISVSGRRSPTNGFGRLVAEPLPSLAPLAGRGLG